MPFWAHIDLQVQKIFSPAAAGIVIWIAKHFCRQTAKKISHFLHVKLLETIFGPPNFFLGERYGFFVIYRWGRFFSRGGVPPPEEKFL